MAPPAYNYTTFIYPNRKSALQKIGCRVRNSKPVEKLLKIEQVSELLEVNRRTLYEWTHIGFIPHYKLPKGVRFKASEVEKRLKNRKIYGRLNYKICIKGLENK